MNITLRPTESEFVDIEHHDWNVKWSIQFPEAIDCSQGAIMAWPRITMPWRRLGEHAWGFTWQPDEAYVRAVLARDLKTNDGLPQYDRFALGARLDTRIAVEDGRVSLSLTLTNTGDHPLTNVRSEGGCFQARSEAFKDGDEVARSFVCVGRTMTSMAAIDRTVPIRCLYVTDPARDTGKFQWFWGKSRTLVDSPAMVGAVSRDGGRAVALGYENAIDAMQNADDHHCLHSGPSFGSLAPGQSVTRCGWVLFGSDIHALGRELASKCQSK